MYSIFFWVVSQVVWMFGGLIGFVEWVCNWDSSGGGGVRAYLGVGLIGSVWPTVSGLLGMVMDTQCVAAGAVTAANLCLVAVCWRFVFWFYHQFWGNN